MKLVAISRVKNEIDIIEAFVRHTVAHFDKLIVLDDGSSDGAYEALLSLQDAGLPLVVIREPSVGYEQSRYMTRLLSMAVHQFGADWVVPLDADEFIEPPPGMTLAQTLAPCGPTPLTVAWNSFVWRPQDDEDPEPNPVLRLRMRLPRQPRQSLGKVLAPAALVMEGGIELTQGNHALVREGQALASEPLESVNLCHFPIRSVAQYAGKIAVGYLQYAAMPDWDRGMGWHYLRPFQLLGGGLDPLRQSMEADSRRYSLEEADPDPGEAVCAPLHYEGGALTLKPRRQEPLANIVRCAEEIAFQRADNLARHTALMSALDRVIPDIDGASVSERIAALGEAVREAAQVATHEAALQAEQARDARQAWWRAEAESSERGIQLDSLRSDWMKLSEDHDRLTGEHCRLSEDHERLYGEHRGLADDHDRLCEDWDAAKHRIALLENELFGLHAVVDGQRRQLSSRTYRFASRLHQMLVQTGLPTVAIADRCARLWRLAKSH